MTVSGSAGRNRSAHFEVRRYGPIPSGHRLSKLPQQGSRQSKVLALARLARKVVPSMSWRLASCLSSVGLGDWLGRIHAAEFQATDASTLKFKFKVQLARGGSDKLCLLYDMSLEKAAGHEGGTEQSRLFLKSTLPGFCLPQLCDQGTVIITRCRGD